MDNRISVIHKENGGLSSARNAGLKNAHGEYFGFVDSDDAIVEDMYEYLYDILLKTDADISMCNFARTEKDLDYNNENEILTEYNSDEIIEFFYRVDGGGSFYCVWNRLYTKEVIKDIQFPDGRINEDVIYTFYVYNKANKIVVSSLKKYFYYINRTGITRGKLRNQDMDLFRNWDEIVSHEKNTKYSYYAELNRKRATFTLYVKGLLYGYADGFDKSVLKDWKRELKKEYNVLAKENILDWKRKIILFIICRIL